jgi:hypothetical protein
VLIRGDNSMVVTIERWATVAGVISVGLIVALVACGCGSASSHTRSNTIVSAPETIRHRAVFARPPADTLVTMRQIATSGLWQTVFVRRNGQGVLTSLIGEISGAPQRSFKLPPDQLSMLRRLIASAPSTAPLREIVGPEIYTLHVSGRAAENLSGPLPKPLAALVGFLSNLMLTYCC